jgi:hypothetical protein
MSRFAQRKTAVLANPASSVAARAILVTMLIGTVLVVLIGGLSGVT